MELFGRKKERIYLDHAGATPLSDRAKKVFVDALELYGNPSSLYKEGVLAKTALYEARKTLGACLSSLPHELYFTGTGTESVSLALLGSIEVFIKKYPKSIPHVITTNIEHPSVREVLKHLEEQKKIEVSYITVNEYGLIKAIQVEELLCERTALVSIMYVNNEIGTIMPIKEIGRIISQYKAKTSSVFPYFHTDACQAANYLPLDVHSLRVDLMTLNSSKVYGPKGVGLLFKKEGVVIEPLVRGGGQERSLRSGTEALPLCMSFAEAMKEAREISHFESKRQRELSLFLKDELEKTIPDIVFYGSFKEGERISNNVNFSVPSIESDEMIIRLDALGFSVSHKSACASEDESMSYVVKALGVNEREAMENIRVTLGKGTTKSDIQKFVRAVSLINTKYKKVLNFNKIIK